MPPINSIDDVLAALDAIIAKSKTDQHPLGYFAALYRQVTAEVKQGIADGFFEDKHRMERLDVLFATRYLEAYHAFEAGQPVTQSWLRAFKASSSYWPIVLQHLLLGMNAHINLDLGIAAAEVSKGQNLEDLKADFNKINQILSRLVTSVENDLASIWPTLKKILRWTRKVDNFLIDFSMEIARDGAWRFAEKLSAAADWDEEIKLRDVKVAELARKIYPSGFVVRLLFSIIRIGERGTVAERIHKLET